jgi:hypothetical protein
MYVSMNIYGHVCTFSNHLSQLSKFYFAKPGLAEVLYKIYGCLSVWMSVWMRLYMFPHNTF